MKIIILAGGKGTRLWPISRGSFPKQFLKLGDELSLLQKCVKRFLPIAEPADFVIVTSNEYRHLVKEQLCSLDPRFESQILVEPAARGTAPAIALGVKYLQEKYGMGEEEVVVVSSSDHLISPQEEFLKAVYRAEEVAKQGYLITFGIEPKRPETGYGYIKIEQTADPLVCKAHEFIEKPPLEQAQAFLKSDEYLWNSGIFAFTAHQFWLELKHHAPEMATISLSNFESMPSVSIDYALMEKSKNIAVIRLNLSWSDIGSWDSIFDEFAKDTNQNVKMGNIVDIGTKNCLIVGGKRLIATMGLEDMIIIETDDAILIGKKGESQKVKALVDELKKQNRKEIHEHQTVYRPWGSYSILEEGDRYKVKRIVVNPHQKLSLQYHYHRSEHWIVVKGAAKVTIGEKETYLHENESTYVPKSAVHRLENPGKVPLEMIEVQVGEYVGEDDIVRIEDVYGRTEELVHGSNSP
ncbi:MAG: mannose-1-phosphate guanylyltransferase/mannose-6-phosphate isomerase [Verrucomicrobia bacterium]|nr:mannose-1-phosphate guanylyltransferase/mannose-6-phosphate isomerase [Verrucomicrobiota bacterium]